MNIDEQIDFYENEINKLQKKINTIGKTAVKDFAKKLLALCKKQGKVVYETDIEKLVKEYEAKV